ncbi:ABC transporter [Laceyella tengchongensis]|uniref:ABC transporter n=1 Tax=Laceyella tengchongensis TaxID=574699 RepID=A0AA45WMQ1_9BACL|nr:ABC transporter [Laceyella tengchongensis]
MFSERDSPVHFSLLHEHHWRVAWLVYTYLPGDGLFVHAVKRIWHESSLRAKGGFFLFLLEAANVNKWLGERLLFTLDEARLEEKEKPRELPHVQFDASHHHPIGSKVVLRLEQVGKPGLFAPLRCAIPTGAKVGVIGANGAGKSTLLQLLVSRAPGVAWASAAKIGFFQQQLNVLDERKSILENVRASSRYDETMIRTVLARLLFRREEVHKPVSVLSGGERVKAALAKVFLSESNVLVLDEPTNFLDLFAREELERVLKSYPGTLLFASHDRHLLREVAERLIIIEDQRAVYFEGTFAEYERSLTRTSASQPKQSAEALLRIETALVEVLGRLGFPLPEAERAELERRFQELVRERDWLKRGE